MSSQNERGPTHGAESVSTRATPGRGGVSRIKRGIRLVAAVLLGYVAHALALSGLVLLVFGRGGVPIPLWSLPVLAATLGILGVTVVLLVHLIAGPVGKHGSLITTGLVATAAVGNLALDVAIEPWWFTVGVLVINVPGMLLTRRHLARARLLTPKPLSETH